MLTWNASQPTSKGVLIGADQSQEWMLGWWYRHYTKHNQFPIAICDFGLSKEGRKKAEHVGHVLPFQKDSLLNKFRQTEDIPADWTDIYPGDLKTIHPIWMLKPFALLFTPFQQTLWIDIDCEIRGPLDDLFSASNNPSGFACALDTKSCYQMMLSKKLLLPGERVYNSGVIAYRHKSQVVDLWSEEVLHHHFNYLGDQDALSRVIYRHRLPINRLHTKFNARPLQAEDPNMVIIHWVKIQGKMRILEKLMLETQS